MKIILLSITTAVACYATISFNPFNSIDMLGKSHGGTKPDIEAYSDGVGIIIKRCS